MDPDDVKSLYAYKPRVPASLSLLILARRESKLRQFVVSQFHECSFRYQTQNVEEGVERRDEINRDASDRFRMD